MTRITYIACVSIVAIALGSLIPVDAGARDYCVQCHAELEEGPDSRTEQVRLSVHGEAQLSCADCHGGDPEAEDMEEAMSPDRGYVGVPAKADIPGFCGKCHSDAMENGAHLSPPVRRRPCRNEGFVVRAPRHRSRNSPCSRDRG